MAKAVSLFRCTSVVTCFIFVSSCTHHRSQTQNLSRINDIAHIQTVQSSIKTDISDNIIIDSYDIALDTLQKITNIKIKKMKVLRNQKTADSVKVHTNTIKRDSLTSHNNNTSNSYNPLPHFIFLLFFVLIILVAIFFF